MGRGDFQSCACPLSEPGARQETRGYSDNYHKSMKWGLERRKGNVPLLEEPKRPSAPALGWEAGWLSPTQWLPSGEEAFREMCMLGLQEGLCCFSGCFLILTASSILLSTRWSAPTIQEVDRVLLSGSQDWHCDTERAHPRRLPAEGIATLRQSLWPPPHGT